MGLKVEGMTITISEKATKIPAVADLIADKNKNLPKWLERQAFIGHVKAMPERSDFDFDVNENLVVEYYSR